MSIEALKDVTYMVRHNPNCPSPFEIRTAGGAGQVDARERRNYVSFGKTLDEAAKGAIAKIDDEARRYRVARAEHAVVGVVWA